MPCVLLLRGADNPLTVSATDNEAKVNGLKAVEETLSAIEDLHGDLFSTIIDSLKLAVKSGNSRVASAGLSCSQSLFHLLRQDSSHGQVPRMIQRAVIELVPAPGIVGYLADARETTRQLAGSVLLAAANAAAAADYRTQAAAEDNVLCFVDKLVKEQGFGSKNPKTREQVRTITVTSQDC